MNRQKATGRADGPDAWQATRAETVLATQFLNDKADYLAPGAQEVGSHTGGNEHELFVSCAPDLALQQQFEHLQPVFIAIHDIGAGSSKRLLAGLASASGRPVQKLVIRRQGYGNALASLDFVELPGINGSAMRMYSTEADAGTPARAGLARTLLAFSRLGVFMVGDLPGHAIEAALQPFREAIGNGPWPNRQLLMLPLASAANVGSQAAELARGSRVDVRTAPLVTRLSDAWEFIQGSWARLLDPDAALTPPRRAVEPLPMRPMPAVPTATKASAFASLDAATRAPVARPAATAAAPRMPGALLQRYVDQVRGLPGVVSCCVFDVASGREAACAGDRPAARELALQGQALLAGMSASSRSLGLGEVLPEAAITLQTHHLLLRAVPGLPTLALHAVLDKSTSNLTLARLQLQRLDALFETPARPSP